MTKKQQNITAIITTIAAIFFTVLPLLFVVAPHETQMNIHYKVVELNEWYKSQIYLNAIICINGLISTAILIKEIVKNPQKEITHTKEGIFYVISVNLMLITLASHIPSIS